MAKVLIVDDDKSIVELLRLIMTREGHEISTASDGRQALDLARQDRPDLIILDVMMPEMDGITVSGILFQDPALRRIPVLILTAKGSSRSIFELVPNVRQYMGKPFDPDELRAKVRQLLAAPAV